MRVRNRSTDPSERLQHALDHAYRYLGHRDRTVAEMRRYLAGQGLGDAIVEDALAELCEQGYLDDALFAQRFTEDRRTLDAWGSERIKRRLAELGVGANTIEKAVGAGDDEHEFAAAVALLRRRFPAGAHPARDRDRALGMLVRKGYAIDLAYDAVRTLSRDIAA